MKEEYIEEAYVQMAMYQQEPKRMYKKEVVKKPVVQVFWELKNGTKIDIDTMTENHLRNTLKMIVTNGLLKPKYESAIDIIGEDYRNSESDLA